MKVYFNSTGYYVTGDKTEVSMSCAPSIDAAHTEIQHLYIVLARALNELRGKEAAEITVFNDSRIIDEMNGTVQPLDNFCYEMWLGIKRHLLPDLLSNVFFRKKNSRTISERIDTGHKTMIHIPDKHQRLEEIADHTVVKSLQNKIASLRRLQTAMANHMRNKYAK